MRARNSPDESSVWAKKSDLLSAPISVWLLVELIRCAWMTSPALKLEQVSMLNPAVRNKLETARFMLSTAKSPNHYRFAVRFAYTNSPQISFLFAY